VDNDFFFEYQAVSGELSNLQVAFYKLLIQTI